MVCQALRHLPNWLQYTGFVVCMHYRNQYRVGTYGSKEAISGDFPRGFWGNPSDLKSPFFKLFDRLEYSFVLDQCGDDMASPLLSRVARESKDRQIVGFSSTTGENHLTGVGADALCDLTPRNLYRTCRDLSKLMGAAPGVAILIA